MKTKQNQTSIKIPGSMKKRNSTKEIGSHDFVRARTSQAKKDT